MTRQTFTWFPEFETEIAQSPKVNVIKFADGYETRTAMGLNNNPETWSLQFTVSSILLPDVLKFIKARGGVESFYWKTPLGDLNKVVCRKWKSVRKKGHMVVNFDFEQVFEQ